MLHENSSLPLGRQLSIDPDISAAKKTLLQTVSKWQEKISGIRPSTPELRDSYLLLIEEFSELRGANLWYPFLGSGFGKGALVELLDGSIKYDFIGGIGPHFFGHSHPDIMAACIDASITDTVMQGHLQQNEDSIELVKTLVQSSGMDHCFLTTSGAMANENALKTAFQSRYPANRILAFEHCFVGRTLATSQITDKPSFRDGLPLNLEVDYIPFYDFEKPEESTENSLKELKKIISRYPKQHAVMILELVQGEGGIYPGSKEFFTKIMTLLKENNILIFDDEIQTFGRLPSLYAFQHFGLEDFIDIVTIGKLSQVCATLFRSTIKPRAGLLSQTFTSSTSAIRTSLVIIKKLLSEGFYGEKGKINLIHNSLVRSLKEIEQRNPHLLRGPYGLGSLIGFTPLDGSQSAVTTFAKKLFDEGVMGFIAGSSPTRMRFLVPAGVITDDDIQKAMAIVEKTLLACTHG